MELIHVKVRELDIFRFYMFFDRSLKHPSRSCALSENRLCDIVRVLILWSTASKIAVDGELNVADFLYSCFYIKIRLILTKGKSKKYSVGTKNLLSSDLD